MQEIKEGSSQFQTDTEKNREDMEFLKTCLKSQKTRNGLLGPYQTNEKVLQNPSDNFGN